MPPIFFIVLILLTAIPAGLLVAWLTKEELRDGRKWFKAIIVASLAGCLVALFFKNYTIMLTLLYMAIATSMSLKK